MRFTKYSSLICVAVATVGCAAARSQVEMLPPARLFTDRAPRDPLAVYLIREGEAAPKPIVRIATIAAHGNAYARGPKLEAAMVKAAAGIGAEVVIVTGSAVTSDETISTNLGGGVVVSEQVHRPHLYGFAGRWASTSTGIYLDKNNVAYVPKGSAGEKAGLREGQKLLAVNGKFVGADPYVVERELLSKSPGDIVELELVATGGEKVVTHLVLQEPVATGDLKPWAATTPDAARLLANDARAAKHSGPAWAIH